jgi:hypothetical protein
MKLLWRYRAPVGRPLVFKQALTDDQKLPRPKKTQLCYRPKTAHYEPSPPTFLCYFSHSSALAGATQQSALSAGIDQQLSAISSGLLQVVCFIFPFSRKVDLWYVGSFFNVVSWKFSTCRIQNFGFSTGPIGSIEVQVPKNLKLLHSRGS